MTTAERPGYAIRAMDPAGQSFGAILGKRFGRSNEAKP